MSLLESENAKMVRLTVDLITKNGPGHNKRRPDETVPHYLSRLTHLYLQEKSIDKLDSIPVCKNLTVLYLYDNYIEKMEHLDFAPKLEHLYLQNNQIKRLENLNTLTKLTKLYIGGNCIKVLEGLENVEDLNELQIENQELPSGEKLMFDPRTLSCLVQSLTILNISANNLDTLTEIGSLKNLQDLNASNNYLNDMKEMSILLKCWPKLTTLNLSGNPICLKNKYRERIIVLAPNIEVLDEKEIQELSRQFLQNWKMSKEVSKHRNEPSEYYTDSFKAELPPISNTNQMPTYVMPEIGNQ
ncbi:phosphatase 1 regulatory subunit 42 [Brachionus plicatilis]|uniref:Phosphatase 1 regulatory subunit 42 n=1 Tax=Brachionus plicatilis TaxID=10195 RepID=A0A3M7SIM1_BRAPC|nr:phosphatase 1 regulatory subunit 42 [Brachionus plicatilis]